MSADPSTKDLKLKYLCRIIGGGTPSKENLDFWNGDIPWVSPKDMGPFRISATEDHITQEAVNASATSILPRDSVVIVVRSGILRHTLPVGITLGEFTINQDMKALVPRRGLCAEFLAYFIKGNEQRFLVEWRKEGTTVESIEQELLVNSIIRVPPTAEQIAVVRFLDCETSKIDDLIAKKQRLIGLLDEKRTALISHAVTQGINGRKCSWAEGRLGRFIRLQRGFDITGAEFATGRFPVISSGGPSGFTDKAMVKGPGVIAGRKGTVGTVYYCDSDYWPHDTTLFVQNFHNSIPCFVYYFLLHLNLGRFDVGAANPTINRNHVHPERVRWPETEDQACISAFLDAELAKISGIVRSIQAVIAKLNEYRSALITAAVTGQLNIREHEEKLEALA